MAHPSSCWLCDIARCLIRTLTYPALRPRPPSSIIHHHHVDVPSHALPTPSLHHLVILFITYCSSLRAKAHNPLIFVPIRPPPCCPPSQRRRSNTKPATWLQYGHSRSPSPGPASSEKAEQAFSVRLRLHTTTEIIRISFFLLLQHIQFFSILVRSGQFSFFGGHAPPATQAEKTWLAWTNIKLDQTARLEIGRRPTGSDPGPSSLRQRGPPFAPTRYSIRPQRTLPYRSCCCCTFLPATPPHSPILYIT
jgi:hypothetical protein